jgi:hypothetical protein
MRVVGESNFRALSPQGRGGVYAVGTPHLTRYGRWMAGEALAQLGA